MPKIFLAGLFHETNTFVERHTPLSDFQITRGPDILDFLGGGSPMDGFLESANAYGWDVVPAVDYRAAPSGPLTDETFETYWSEFKPLLIAAIADGLDAIYLVLHGAMVTATHRDAEGELLARIRQIPGAENLPLVAVLDLHVNISPGMATHATALVPYLENPHTDARATAVRAAKHLHHILTTGVRPRIFLRHSRILLAPPATGTAGPIMEPLERLAREMETSNGHLEVGIGAGFSHADTPDTGLSFWVVSDRSEDLCLAALDRLDRNAQTLARANPGRDWDLDEALDAILAERKFPALLVEPADNIGGGTAGDCTSILRALLARQTGPCGVILNDPDAVTRLRATDVGDSIRLPLGGRGSSFDPGPVELEVTLQRITDGGFELEDKQSHMASMVGSRFEMGPCAVVTHGAITILLTSRPTAPMDLGQWRSQGIDPETFEIIAVKAAVAHRRAYDPIAKSSFTVRSPGPCSSDLRSLPYKYLRRPIYPLDD